jgi:hypothetical protein
VKKPRLVAMVNNFSFLPIAFSLCLCTIISCCAWPGTHQDRTIITETGIAGFIEINMALDEFARKKIAHTKMNSPFRQPNQTMYNVDQRGIQFETQNDIIVRIWFFAEKKSAFKILMPKEDTERSLHSISGEDIVKNFGPVIKLVNQNPPKGKRVAMWIKYRPFGIDTNTIDYPGSPFHFGLNWDDSLSYISVSKID